MNRLHSLPLLLLVLACRPAQPSPVIPPPAIAQGSGFLARQTVIAHHRGGTARFDAVLQSRGDELLLLGLTPMGTKAFAVRQRGTTIEVERFVDMPLPAPPEAVLLDIHRAWLDDRPTAIRSDGWHRRSARDAAGRTVRIHERWAAGRLYERIWGSRRSGRSDRVHWPEGIAPGDRPQRVELEHPALELRLEIHTLEIRALDPPASSTPTPSPH